MPEEIIWKPSKRMQQRSHLNKFNNFLKRKHGFSFEDYDAMWEWSVAKPAQFWEAVSEYFKVIWRKPYSHVLRGHQMPDFEWFVGSELNYAEHVFRRANTKNPAILYQNETTPLTAITWDEMSDTVAALQHFFRKEGIQKGDRVAAFMPNIPEASMSMLATISMGAVWSSCSPDFGIKSVVERFKQIAPRVLVVVDGYRYNGKPYDKSEVVRAIIKELPSVEQVVLVPFLNPQATINTPTPVTTWETIKSDYSGQTLTFESVPFDHPIYILYSSGTTGNPKAITHSHGGNLLEHFKYLGFHNDVHAGERFFWFSTTGWMMWNFVHASWLLGATVVLYDGSPGYPDLNVLWEMTAAAPIHHFGTSAPFLIANMRHEISPKAFDISALRSIGSTGSPLPPEAYEWTYKNVKKSVWLCSMSGGTDVCTAFVGGCPTLPLYKGEIQCRALGSAVYAYDENGIKLVNEVGEMVITKPMPSMPIYFWNDPNKERYRKSYFSEFPGVWRHGDWITITNHESVIIHGRSDATLNRQGVRIGTAEIYRALDQIPAIKDSLIINIEKPDGSDTMPLFIQMEEGQELTSQLIKLIQKTLRQTYSPRHVPDVIHVVKDIPYTISGKKMETPIKRIFQGKRPVEKAINKDAMRNPQCVQEYVDLSEQQPASH